MVGMHQCPESGWVNFGFGLLLAGLIRIGRATIAGLKVSAVAIFVVGVFAGALVLGCLVAVRKWSKALLRHPRGFDAR